MKKSKVYLYLLKKLLIIFFLYCINILIQYEIPIHFINPENKYKWKDIKNFYFKKINNTIIKLT
jgi:hypothetical protein